MSQVPQESDWDFWGTILIVGPFLVTSFLNFCFYYSVNGCLKIGYYPNNFFSLLHLIKRTVTYLKKWGKKDRLPWTAEPNLEKDRIKIFWRKKCFLLQRRLDKPTSRKKIEEEKKVDYTRFPPTAIDLSRFRPEICYLKLLINV